MTVLLYIVLCLIWGSTWLAIKIGLQAAPPLWTASFRFVLSVLILAAIVAIRRGQYPKSFRELLSLGYPGLFMYGGSYACVYFAEQRIDSALAAVLFGSFPFAVAVLSLVYLKHERLGWRAWVGMCIGFAGVIVISYDTMQTSADMFVGSLLLLAGVLLSAYGLVMHKRRHSQENVFVSATVQMCFGGIILLLAAAVFEDFSSFQLSLEAIGSIVYLSIFGTVIAFTGYYHLLRKLSAFATSLIALVTPLVAMMIGLLFAGESFTLPIFTGAGMILSGVALANTK